MAIPTLHIDFETRSILDLKAVGLWNYVRHPSTGVWCMAWAFNGDEPSITPPFQTTEKAITGLWPHIESGGIVVAHNAPFELGVWNEIMVKRYGWPILRPEQTYCTMARVYAMGLPGALEDAALALGLPVFKDAEGRNVGRNYYQANSEYKATDDVYDHSLNNVLTSRRFMDEAHIKLRRGNAGTHARNIEAAVIDDQDPNEGWTRMNLLGSMLTHEVGPNIIESITARIHESQGRLLQGFGALQDSATGKWELPDYDIVKQTNIDITAKSGGDTHKKELLEEQQTQHIRGMDKMVTTARLNRKMFNAITGSDRLFTYEQRSHFATNFNEYLDAKGIPSAGQGAIERINISDLPGEPRSARGGSGAGQGGGAAQPIITPPTGFGSGARSTTTFPGGGPGLTTPGPNAPGTPGNVPGAPPSGANPSPGGTNPGGPTIITP